MHGLPTGLPVRLLTMVSPTQGDDVGRLRLDDRRQDMRPAQQRGALLVGSPVLIVVPASDISANIIQDRRHIFGGDARSRQPGRAGSAQVVRLGGSAAPPQAGHRDAQRMTGDRAFVGGRRKGKAARAGEVQRLDNHIAGQWRQRDVVRAAVFERTVGIVHDAGTPHRSN